MTEKIKIIDQIKNIPKQVRATLDQIVANREEFCSGYLRIPPTNGETNFIRTTSDGSFKLVENFIWNQDINCWQINSRQWVQRSSSPEVHVNSGIFAGIKTRLQKYELECFNSERDQKLKYFDPPTPSDSTNKKKRWGNSEYGYYYQWNPERQVWDEVGRFVPAEPQGQMH